MSLQKIVINERTLLTNRLIKGGRNVYSTLTAVLSDVVGMSCSLGVQVFICISVRQSLVWINVLNVEHVLPEVATYRK
jgi:hypothetical protein